MWRRSIALCLLLAATFIHSATQARADAVEDCFSSDYARRITGCSDIIQSPTTARDMRANAYSARALAYSMLGQNSKAIADYDQAIRLNPNFAVALNNRAWSLFKMGQGQRGMANVERSLKLSPLSAHTYDTRAHIRQATGHPNKAFADYRIAMRLGGRRMTRLYQCGLQEFGLYKGILDGIDTPILRQALKACIKMPKCDPLPADEECRQATS